MQLRRCAIKADRPVGHAAAAGPTPLESPARASIRRGPAMCRRSRTTLARACAAKPAAAPACRPSSCSARRRWKPAGASARSVAPTAATAITCSASRPAASWNGQDGRGRHHRICDGVPQKHLAKFRAYDSLCGLVPDYASLMKSNPRYAERAGQRAGSDRFAQGLQRAGYATDPQLRGQAVAHHQAVAVGLKFPARPP